MKDKDLVEKNPIELVKKGESETLELKPSLSQIKEIIQAISAFANKKGGRIIIGVSSDGKILGLKIGRDTVERLTNRILSNSEPKVYPRIKVKEISRKDIIVIEVDESSEKPVLVFGRAFKRVGKSTVRMTKNEIEKLILERKKVYWDEQICEGAALNDIDKEKIRWFVKESRKQRNLNLEEGLSVRKVLMRLKLLKDNKLTNAAVLLFGKDSKFLQSEVKCIKFSGNEPIKPYIDFQTLEGNVFDLIDKAEDFVLRNVKKAIWLVPGQVQREEKYEYPTEAIREAIVNAISHRDYESPSKVQIRTFGDYIEIWNPGRLPGGWTVEKLKQEHESVPRNPLLFKQLFWVKYVEDVGGGTIDMINKCKEWGIPEPDFEDTGTSIVVTFRKSFITKKLMDELSLNERQKKAINYLNEHKKITTKNYCELFGVVKDTANRDLNDLLNKKLIERKGSGPKVCYILSTVRYRPIPSDDLKRS